MPKKITPKPAPKTATIRNRVGLPQNGAGFLTRVLDILDEDLLWDPTGNWMCWDGRKYAPTTGTMIPVEFLNRLNEGFDEEIEVMRRLTDDADEIKRFSKFLKGPLATLSSTSSLSKILREATSITYDYLKPPPRHLLATPNGVINLRDGTLQPHDKTHRFTFATSVPYNPEAEAPVFEKFMKEFCNGDDSLEEYLYRVLGYVITGEIEGEQCWYLNGGGRNGKTTLLNVLSDLLGSGYGHFNGGFLTRAKYGNATDYDAPRLANLRCAVVGEIGGNAEWDEERVKNMSSNSVLTVRQIFGQPFSMQPTHKLIMFGNDKPTTRNSTLGFWRRFKFIPCDHSVAEEDVDRDLPRKLRAELSGILSLLVARSIEYYREGLPELSERLLDEQKNYAEQSDLMLTFFTEMMEAKPGASAKVSEVAIQFQEWQDEYIGESDRSLSAHILSRWITSKGFKKTRKRDGADRASSAPYFYTNLRLKNHD